jgi:hypothetical protein
LSIRLEGLEEPLDLFVVQDPCRVVEEKREVRDDSDRRVVPSLEMAVAVLQQRHDLGVT